MLAFPGNFLQVRGLHTNPAQLNWNPHFNKILSEDSEIGGIRETVDFKPWLTIVPIGQLVVYVYLHKYTESCININLKKNNTCLSF